MRTLIGSLLVTLISWTAAPAHAQLNRAYVSVERGNDVNACSYASPCRSIGQAVSQLNSGGEVILIDGGGFTPFTIDRAAAIQVPSGVFAGVIAGSGAAILIDSGVESNVSLSGLTLTGVGTATRGVRVESVGVLSLEKLTVSGFLDVGLHVNPSNTSRLVVDDSSFRDTAIGVRVGATTGQTAAVIRNSRFSSTRSAAVLADENSMVTVIGCTSLGGTYGYAAVEDGAATAGLVVENSSASRHTYAVAAIGTVAVWVSNSTLSYNDAVGYSFDSGVILSRGNNTLAGNSSNAGFTNTFAPQ